MNIINKSYAASVPIWDVGSYKREISVFRSSQQLECSFLAPWLLHLPIQPLNTSTISLLNQGHQVSKNLHLSSFVISSAFESPDFSR